jgi:hypothetical protein
MNLMDVSASLRILGSVQVLAFVSWAVFGLMLWATVLERRQRQNRFAFHMYRVLSACAFLYGVTCLLLIYDPTIADTPLPIGEHSYSIAHATTLLFTWAMWAAGLFAWLNIRDVLRRQQWPTSSRGQRTRGG